jgi:DivIVA domain-containing protein
VAGEGIEPVQTGRDVPAEIRNVSFPTSRRGYDRQAVDEYVTRVNALIVEFEATQSPEAAVKQALRQVGEKTSTILQQAGETAEEITVAARQNAEADTARAKKEADELVANARAEAEEIRARSSADAETMRAEASTEATKRLQRADEEVTALREEAEARLRELQADTEAVRTERRALLGDIRELAARVEEAANGADARFPPREEADAAQEPTPETESKAETGGNGAESKPARPPRTHH